jgi:hypothetical protein
MCHYRKQRVMFNKLLERLAWHCRAMTCSPVMGSKVVDILQDFRSWNNFLRVYGIS